MGPIQGAINQTLGVGTIATKLVSDQVDKQVDVSEEALSQIQEAESDIGKANLEQRKREADNALDRYGEDDKRTRMAMIAQRDLERQLESRERQREDKKKLLSLKRLQANDILSKQRLNKELREAADSTGVDALEDILGEFTRINSKMKTDIAVAKSKQGGVK